jgi:riboflavin-specific deaminase-like protein
MSPKSKVQSPKSAALPYVFLNVATTADGKLAPANRHFIPFSSKRDQELLMELRTCADAVMAGARTVDSVPVTLGPGGKKHRERRVKNGLAEYNLRVVVSGSGSVNPRAKIFQYKFSPLIILVSRRASQARITRLQKLGAIVHMCGEKNLNFTEALEWLRAEWNVKRLLCEGGGEINAALFREDLVDELHLTLSPKIFGGRNAPTLTDGSGIASLIDATRVELKSKQRVGNEMFLRYRVVR